MNTIPDMTLRGFLESISIGEVKDTTLESSIEIPRIDPSEHKEFTETLMIALVRPLAINELVRHVVDYLLMNGYESVLITRVSDKGDVVEGVTEEDFAGREILEKQRMAGVSVVIAQDPVQDNIMLRLYESDNFALITSKPYVIESWG